MECKGCGAFRFCGFDGGRCSDCHKARLATGWRPEPIDAGGDYLTRAGMDTDLRLDEWREDAAMARAEAQEALGLN